MWNTIGRVQGTLVRFEVWQGVAKSLSALGPDLGFGEGCLGCTRQSLCVGDNGVFLADARQLRGL